MATHQLSATSGETFELVLGDDGRIADVAGPWPEERDAEFELEGPIPTHANVSAPDHVMRFAAEAGREVCFYDPDGCRTCFCDEHGKLLYCRKMC
jgi:hypothetical protein